MKETLTSETRVKGHGWREVAHDLPAVLVETGTKAYIKGPCRVLLSHEPHGRRGVMRWHLSISCLDRYPGWEEIKDARYSLLPLGLTFAQILPPPNEYTNIHRNCFHLWEIGEEEW